MRFEYPILPNSTKDKEEDKESLIASYFGHNNQLGFYPVGRLNSWHGGIHIEGLGKEVRAIADGRVIAYRMPEDYYPREEDTDQPKYSNGFLLLQHDEYVSPKKQKLRFYSLYMHLMPKVQMENSGKVPDFYAKYNAKATGNEIQRGLNARSGSEMDGSFGKKVVLIPVGATVTLDPIEDATPTSAPQDIMPGNGFNAWNSPFSQSSVNTPLSPVVTEPHWTEAKKSLKYKRVKYKNYTDIYIATSEGRIKDIGNNQLQITTVENDISKYEKSPTKGVVVYDKANKKGQGKYLRTIKKGTEIGEVTKKSEAWYQIKDKEEYIAAAAIKVTATLKDDVVIDTIKNEDVIIKAGDVLGFTGNYGFGKQKHYGAVHIEVFTDDTEVKNFIVNTKGDDDRTQYETPENSTLQVGKPVNDLKKDTKVKVYQRKGDFAEIGFEDITKTIPTEGNIWISNSNGKKPEEKGYSSTNGYAILDFDKVNEYFENALEKDKSKIFYVAKTKIDEKDARTVILKQPNSRKNKKFWVKADTVPAATQSTETIELQPKPIKVKGLGINEILATDSAVANPTPATTANTEPYWAALTKDVAIVYDIEPTTENTKDITVAKKMRVKRKVTTAKDHSGTEWWKIKGQYEDDKGDKKTETGWIKKEKLTTLNPYDWESYGWKLYEDTGDQYFYRFNANEGEEPHQFIKDIWAEVDLPEKQTQPDETVKEVPGDKVLTQHELQQAMRDKRKVNILSKLICKHHNEWDTWQRIDTFKTEVEEIYQKGIELEEDTEKKQKLEEIRDERIALLEEKIQHLSFWQDIKDGNIAPPAEKKKEQTTNSYQNRFNISALLGETHTPPATHGNDNLGPMYPNGQPEKKEEKPKRSFPSDSTVYHFHPIAFVEQMKMIAQPVGLQFEIYADGSIIRRGKEDSETASYIYHDKNGSSHELGTWEIKVNDVRYKNGKEEKPKTGDYVVRYSPIYEADVYYAKIPGKMRLINIKKKPLNYKKGDLLISYFHNSNREYVDIGAFASFIGAIAEVSYDDIVLNGFTNEDGIGNPSKTHVNGVYGDLRYFNKSKVKKKLLITSTEFDELRQNKLIDALYKFGYKGMASYKYGANNDKLVHHGKHVSGHKNHLHIQGYNPKHIQIK